MQVHVFSFVLICSIGSDRDDLLSAIKPNFTLLLHWILST